MSTKKFEGMLICTDLDGTLLRRDKSISKENLEAIEYFKAEGGVFTFITGRMPYSSMDIYRAIRPNAPFGCINGGGLYDPIAKDYLWMETLSPDVLTLVESVADQFPEMGIQINAKERLWFCRENSIMANFRRVTNTPNLVCGIRDVNEPIGKILFGQANTAEVDRLAEVLPKYPGADRFEFIRSEEVFFEVLPKGISKGSVLPKLTAHLGLEMARTVAIGDYDNDIRLLQTAKIGVAVANASEHAKAAADYITVSNEEHAMAAVISDIEKGVLRLE
ncbi:MAG: HAD family phosphatase [Clostridia bacterium]|nr:HAD family phosphatase [Clostridia bacterium]